MAPDVIAKVSTEDADANIRRWPIGISASPATCQSTNVVTPLNPTFARLRHRTAPRHPRKPQRRLNPLAADMPIFSTDLKRCRDAVVLPFLSMMPKDVCVC